MRLAASLIALSALAACGRDQTSEPTKADEPVEAKEVAAADGYGEPGETVNAVAFWSHPAVAFESLVIAATDDGLKTYNVETGELKSSAGEAAKDVAVIYDGAAPAQGYAIAASEAPGYSFFKIDNETLALTAQPVEEGEPATRRFCAGRSGGGNALYEIDADGVARRNIGIANGQIRLGDPQAFSETGGDACHVDDRTGHVIVVGEDGAIRKIDAKSGESSGIAIAASGGPSALVLKKDGGRIALLDPETAVVSVYDLGDGRSLGAMKVKSTFDLEAVASARTVAAGSGNYGGVYRDGILAVVTDEGPPIRLVPWNGVVSALGLEPAEGIDPRAPQATAAEDDLLDIELKKP